MDIRNYFSPVNKKKLADKPVERKRKIIVSDDEDPLPVKSQFKHKYVTSESDEDIFEGTPQKKKKDSKKTVEKTQRNGPVKSESPKLKVTTVNDFFGSDPVKHGQKNSSKRKACDSNVDHSEDSFEKTLRQLDNPKSFKKIKKDESKHKSESPKKAKRNDKPSPERNYVTPAKLRDEKTENNHVKSEKKSPSKNVSNGLNKKGLASKLSEKMKEKKDSEPIQKNNCEKPPEGTKENDSKGVHIEDNEQKKSPVKKENLKDKSKETKKFAGKATMERNKKELVSKESKFTKGVSDIKISPKKQGQNNISSQSVNGSEQAGETTDFEEQKKKKKMSYLKFLNRKGPRDPGSKPLPEGKPGCLSGLTFVLTGVLSSIDKDETIELIKKYGGRVTTNVSRMTSYLVIGDEHGESKIKKADQLGTKTLDEDGLFELIQSQPAHSNEDSLTKTDRLPKEMGSPLSSKSSVSSSISPPSTKNSPSSKCSFLKTKPISSQELLALPSEDLMWVDKYKPTSLKSIIGQQGDQSNAKKLLSWLKNWFTNQCGTKKLVRPSPWAKDNTGAYFKAALLSGPPGVGKTTTSHLVCKELGFDVVEMNASDTRSKRALGEEVSKLLTNKSLSGYMIGSTENKTSRNHVLLMDEVDGMAGNEDRGGVQELIGLIKASKIPIICMCNDRNHPKIRSLANYCFDLRFHKPRIEQIRGAMMSVCFREGIKVKPDALDQMIIGSNQDIRQVLHHLSMWSADQKVLESEKVKKEANMSKKEFKLGPWDVCTKVFSESAHKTMSIHDKISLFFNDYSIGPLFIQENYLKVSPHCARGNKKKLLEQMAKTSYTLADSDLIEKAIRKDSAWSLLPTQALFSSVFPGEYMKGHFSSQVEFPRWLGNNSKKNKFDRLAQELHTHMRLRVSGSKLDVLMDYSPRLRDAIVEPLYKNGLEGVKESVNVMTSNDLLREDLESVVEISTWPGVTDKMANVESKVKAAFTRTLNKESSLTPFSNVMVSKKSMKGLEAEYDEDNIEEEGEEEEEEVDISKDSKIKVGKKTPKTLSKGETSKGSKGSKGLKGKGRK